MARSNRRARLAAVLVPLLFLAMAGWARATTITVNTLDGGSPSAPLCTLEDAVTAANNQTVQNGCAAGSGNDTIVFAVSGTISISGTLSPTDPTLSIVGPIAGGITISGSNTIEIIFAVNTNLALKNLTLANGSYVGSGGAIETFRTNLEIEHCTFVGNTAEAQDTHNSGGAIFLEDGTATIINSTFANNTASDGGAISDDGATLTITNSTFSGNSAGFGAAVGAPGGLTSMRGVILANSTGGGSNCDGTITNDGFNVDDGTSCGFSAVNGSKSSTNPLLEALASNGGPTQTFALETSPSMSPAIGLDTDCTDQESPTPQTVLIDQRLFIRPNSPSKCDSGAYEHDGVQSITAVPNSERLQIARSSLHPARIRSIWR